MLPTLPTTKTHRRIDPLDHTRSDGDQCNARQDQERRSADDLRDVRTEDRRRSAAEDRPRRCPRARLARSDVGITAAVADGIVAGSGDATASIGGTPRSASIGVAIDEPPTPNNPVRLPINAPARTNTGQGAMPLSVGTASA